MNNEQVSLTKETIDTLSNFSTINNSIIIPAGNRIRVINEASTCIAYADVEETFPMEFGVYDISQFLSVQSLVNDGKIEFNEGYLTIQNASGTTLRYKYSDPEFIKSAPETVDFPYEGAVDFTLTETVRDSIKNAADRLKLNAISFVSEAGSSDIFAAAIDEKGQDDNNFRVLIGSNDAIIDNEFSFNISPMLIKSVKKGDYEVTVSPQGISEFKGSGIQYFIALSGKSEFK